MGKPIVITDDASDVNVDLKQFVTAVDSYAETTG